MSVLFFPFCNVYKIKFYRWSDDQIKWYDVKWWQIYTQNTLVQNDCLDPSGMLSIPIGSNGEKQHMQSITIKTTL